MKPKKEINKDEVIRQYARIGNIDSNKQYCLYKQGPQNYSWYLRDYKFDKPSIKYRVKDNNTVVQCILMLPIESFIDSISNRIIKTIPSKYKDAFFTGVSFTVKDILLEKFRNIIELKSHVIRDETLCVSDFSNKHITDLVEVVQDIALSHNTYELHTDYSLVIVISGKAHLDPADTFNEHIGKQIAQKKVERKRAMIEIKVINEFCSRSQWLNHNLSNEYYKTIGEIIRLNNEISEF